MELGEYGMKPYLLRLVACLFLCVSLNSFGALYDRGNGLIYDDVLDITWLQDANYAHSSGYSLNNATENIYSISPLKISADGQMAWEAAKNWAYNLTYMGFTEFRLPSTNFIDSNDVYTNTCWANDGSCGRGFNITNSELGHMYYVNLENPSEVDENGNDQFPGNGIDNLNTNFLDSTSNQIKDFINISYAGQIWFAEGYQSYQSNAYRFITRNGMQRDGAKYQFGYAWAVHDGDIGLAPVPLPAGITLFLSGLVGLGLMRGRNG